MLDIREPYSKEEYAFASAINKFQWTTKWAYQQYCGELENVSDKLKYYDVPKRKSVYQLLTNLYEPINTYPSLEKLSDSENIPIHVVKYLLNYQRYGIPMKKHKRYHKYRIIKIDLVLKENNYVPE